MNVNRRGWQCGDGKKPGEIPKHNDIQFDFNLFSSAYMFLHLYNLISRNTIKMLNFHVVAFPPTARLFRLNFALRGARIDGEIAFGNSDRASGCVQKLPPFRHMKHETRLSSSIQFILAMHGNFWDYLDGGRKLKLVFFSVSRTHETFPAKPSRASLEVTQQCRLDNAVEAYKQF